MAFKTGVYTAKAALILTPTAYATGGTDLGMIQSVHSAGFKHETEMLTKQNYGAEFVDARILGTNIIYQIIIANRSTSLMEIMFHGRAVSDAFGDPAYNRGNPVTSAETFQLLIRPTDTTAPKVYIPRAFIMDLGPVTWDRRRGHLQDTILTIVGLRDGATTAPFYYGDSAQFPALGGGA